uniref:Uncharacterized protein n=1 Tax=Nelumbo nucifera TaxID=4432 RepID=A0A822Z8N8_NELNU|nr:TPA_asm: hypothetical protein HUJ06_014148 [Nelumbo nucifera]
MAGYLPFDESNLIALYEKVKISVVSFFFFFSFNSFILLVNLIIEKTYQFFLGSTYF